MKYKALSIAGFDGSGGAGIQADLKTFSALDCYGMNVLTALPVQNTCGVRNCYEIPLTAIKEQLEAIFDDIIPDSIKIGMLFNSEIIQLVAEFLQQNAPNIPIVLDPVMVAKSGNPLLLPEAVNALKELLIPMASVITPNLPEALVLIEENISLNYKVMPEIAEKLLSLKSKAVLLKAGHLEENSANDLYLTQDGTKLWLKGPRIVSRNVHGTGCTLSAAITAYLAKGESIEKSCENAKLYIAGAIASAKDKTIGKGQGPVDHFYNVRNGK